MRPVVHGFFSPEFELDPTVLNSEEGFVILLQVFYGPEGGPGEEVLSITVASIDALESFMQDGVGFFGNGLMIVDNARMDKIEDFVRRRVEMVRGDSWIEITRKLGRIGHLEFDDYVWKDK